MKYKVFGQIAPHIKNLKDVTVQGDTISFGNSWEKTAAESVLTHATTSEKAKESSRIIKKEISADDKAIILTMIGGEIAKQIDNFGVYEFIASTDEIDTDNDKFEKSLLDIWAAQYAAGVPFVYRHDFDSGIGQTYKASVVRNEVKNRWELLVGVYVLPTAKLETDLAINIIDGGIFKNASIRGIAGVPKPVRLNLSEDSWNDTMWVYAGDSTSKALELSLVPWGANTSATRIKEKQNIQFQLIDDIMKEELKHLSNAETEITAELVKDMSEKLQSYQVKEATERQVKVDLFVNKSLTIDPNADKEDWKPLQKD
jgi:hypothetical protein